ncbi:MAG: hypothetical protein ACI9CD_000742 [Candidatus Deianiraeaceae bacterium]|jgi:hypothetical protein
MSLSIRVSRFFCAFLAVLAIIFLSLNWYITALSFLIFSILELMRKVDLSNKDAKYYGILQRTSIKDIESIDCVGLGMFNRVTICGRGSQKIKISFVEDYYKVRHFAENIDSLK